MIYMPTPDAYVVAAPDGYECWRERVSDFAQQWMHSPACQVVFKRGRSVAIRCAIRRAVLKGARSVTVVELTCTRGGTPSVIGCFPLCRRMLEAIAGPELRAVSENGASAPPACRRDPADG